MILYFVRHGDPIYDPDSLTPLGVEQARALAKRFTVYGLDEVYCSTSNRAIMTAQPTCDILKKKMVLLDWANEGHAAEQLWIKNERGSSWAFHHPEYWQLFRSNEIKN